MNVAIIGAGLIGNKRADALQIDDNLIYVCDKDSNKARNLAKKYGASYGTDSSQIAKRDDIDLVIVSVINKFIASIAINMLKTGKHVLCEKPLGQNVNESLQIIRIAKKTKRLVKTGFNHRFHPAIFKVKELLGKNKIGRIINIRSRYGHGGRPGMENEWRCSEELCGGGELLDQGVHIVDLCHWFVGDVKKVYGKVLTSFWPIKVEDNAFFLLFFKDNIIAQCHVSWTNWKNIFSFEIHGTDGYIRVEGLGGSYGIESLEYGKRNKKGGKPDIKHYEYPQEDISWREEWEEFKQAIKQNREPIGNAMDGLVANKVIEAIYKSSESNIIIKL